MPEETSTGSPIAFVSEEAKDAIKRKSAYSLPNNPSERGYTASQIRDALYKAIIDEDNSALSELNRVIKDVNEAFSKSEEKLKQECVNQSQEANKLYGTNDNGEECCYDVSTGTNANTVVQRDGNGDIIVVGNPGDSGAMNKAYADTLYVKRTDVSTGTNANAVVKRDANGDIIVRDNPADSGAINKSFADGRYVKLDGLGLNYNPATHELQINYKVGGETKSTTAVDLVLESAITGIETKEENDTTKFRFIFGDESNNNEQWYELSSLVNLSKYVQKTTDSNRLYGTGWFGETTYEIEKYSETKVILGEAGSVVRRSTGGNLNVPETPTDDNHAVSKKYVNNMETKISQYESDAKTALEGIIAIQEQYIKGYPAEVNYE